jgi:hypothetical protein
VTNTPARYVPPAEAVEVVPYRPLGAGIDPKEAGKAARNLLQVVQEVRSNLVEGQDYGTFANVKTPTLLKPGAEKLAIAFELSSRHAEPKMLEHDGDAQGVESFCTLFRNGADGAEHVIATAHAYAGYDEKQFVYRDRDGKEYGRAPWNTLVRMAEKRAFIAAVRVATATSGVFSEEGAVDQREQVDDTRAELVIEVQRLANTLGAPQLARFRKWLQRNDLPERSADQSTVELVRTVELIYALRQGILGDPPPDDDGEQKMVPPTRTHGTRKPRGE